MNDASPLRELFLFLLLFGHAAVAPAQTPGTFIPTGNMTTPRYGHTATLLFDGKVLIAGGLDVFCGSSFASAEIYDPATGTFIATGRMSTPRAGHTATRLADGKVLIAGGTQACEFYGGTNNILASAELYDPATGTFTATGNMTTVQIGHTATLLDDGKVLIAGGTDDADRANITTAELFDPAAGTFASTGAYAGTDIRGFDARATLLPDGRVLLISWGVAEIYDPRVGTFSLTGGPQKQRWSSTLLINGEVLFVGGNDDPGPDFGAELYDLSTETFSPTGNMTTPRYGHTATLLTDGTVLIAGGQQRFPGIPRADAELYDPVTANFRATGDMAKDLTLHTATLLNNGQVLIAGGYVQTGNTATAAAELYIPSTSLPAQVVTDVRFDRPSVVVGSSYSANISGSNLKPETFFDIRFTSPGNNSSDVVSNWQRSPEANHDVPAGTVPGIWTINGVRAHEIETDHAGSFFPVSATITVSP